MARVRPAPGHREDSLLPQLRSALLSLTLVTTACAATAPPLDPPGACPGANYPSAAEALYSLPFPAGTTLRTGLANCSTSFHGQGRPDQYATDFDQPEGAVFLAARRGVVTFVQEDQPSGGGGRGGPISGNGVFVDHGDGTTALYLHSPFEGIMVNVGDTVAVGDALGVVGASGLAGYPHLHFIVVVGSTAVPYTGVPVSFRNAEPSHTPLRSYTNYTVLPGGVPASSLRR